MNGFTMFLGEKSMTCYNFERISYKHLTELKGKYSFTKGKTKFL